eukprot:90614-Chlamydomonas_euryale.AAC.1
MSSWFERLVHAVSDERLTQPLNKKTPLPPHTGLAPPSTPHTCGTDTLNADQSSSGSNGWYTLSPMSSGTQPLKATRIWRWPWPPPVGARQNRLCARSRM